MMNSSSLVVLIKKALKTGKDKLLDADNTDINF